VVWQHAPPHVMRQSRRSSTLMMTFPAPAGYSKKFSAPKKAATAAFAEVRKRLIPYDSTSPSPLLGRYGNHDGREHQQYFLNDENHQALGCPFAKLRPETRPRKSKVRSKAA